MYYTTLLIKIGKLYQLVYIAHKGGTLFGKSVRSDKLLYAQASYLRVW